MHIKSLKICEFLKAKKTVYIANTNTTSEKAIPNHHHAIKEDSQPHDARLKHRCNCRTHRLYAPALLRRLDRTSLTKEKTTYKSVVMTALHLGSSDTRMIERRRSVMMMFHL